MISKPPVRLSSNSRGTLCKEHKRCHHAGLHSSDSQRNRKHKRRSTLTHSSGATSLWCGTTTCHISGTLVPPSAAPRAPGKGNGNTAAEVALPLEGNFTANKQSPTSHALSTPHKFSTAGETEKLESQTDALSGLQLPFNHHVSPHKHAVTRACIFCRPDSCPSHYIPTRWSLREPVARLDRQQAEDIHSCGWHTTGMPAQLQARYKNSVTQLWHKEVGL